MISKEILEEIGKKKGLLNKEHVEKDYFQDLLLFNIYSQTNLLIFKGGAALYKLYGLARFSEDLDFSLIEEPNAEEIIKKILENIKGAKIKDVKKIKDSLLIKILFDGIITRQNTVRIDINLKNPVLEKFEVKGYTPSYIDINPFSLRVLNLKEIVAEKIHSILNRESARDLYDLFFLSKFVELDKKLVIKKLSVFSLNYNYKKLQFRIENLEPVWEKELSPFVLSGLPDFQAVKAFVLGKLEKLK